MSSSRPIAPWAMRALLATLVPFVWVVTAPTVACGAPAEGSKLAPKVSRQSAHYRVEVRQGSAKAGQALQAELRILPRAGYKVNVQYPTRVELGASDGVALAASRLSNGDALELSGAQARFPVRFSSTQPGERRLEAKLRFSVCSAKQCDLARETLSWALTVEP